jgi:spore coat polysaccharide biosynthesis protein SpsF
MSKVTEQEEFWRGSFGDEYTDRNRGADWVAANIAFFSKILNHTNDVQDVLELGSNIGLNLMALRALFPRANLSAVEINEKAGLELKQRMPDVDLHVSSIFDFESSKQWDLTFTKGVLIHINPDRLSDVYRVLYGRSSKYVLIAEYYNPAPTEIVYRGETGKLFKRDFAGEMLDSFTDLKLINYGFAYHRDPNFPQDDISWFLMKKDSSVNI